MSGEKPQPVYRNDYRQPDYWIDEVDLHFELGEDDTWVNASLSVRINDLLSGDPPPLVLHGEDLDLVRVRRDGRELRSAEYLADEKSLTVQNVPRRFQLETRVRIRPARISCSLSWFHTHSRSPVCGIRRRRGGEYELARSLGRTGVQVTPASSL